MFKETFFLISICFALVFAYKIEHFYFNDDQSNGEIDSFKSDHNNDLELSEGGIDEFISTDYLEPTVVGDLRHYVFGSKSCCKYIA